ncbi:MAG: hypothetical protein E7194_00050 [Erysipelotrichaceae bacterium]|nr:hypothetical protein [Erysipelotrichaceae bacterium]
MKQISAEDYAQYDTRIKEIVAQKEAEQLSTIIGLLNQICTIAEENKSLCGSEEEARALLHIDLNKEPSVNLIHIDAKYFGYKLADKAERLKYYCEDFIA